MTMPDPMHENFDDSILEADLRTVGERKTESLRIERLVAPEVGSIRAEIQRRAGQLDSDLEFSEDPLESRTSVRNRMLDQDRAYLLRASLLAVMISILDRQGEAIFEPQSHDMVEAGIEVLRRGSQWLYRPVPITDQTVGALQAAAVNTCRCISQRYVSTPSRHRHAFLDELREELRRDLSRDLDYVRPKPRSSPSEAAVAAMWLASAISSGIAGNISYDLAKSGWRRLAQTWRERHGQDPTLDGRPISSRNALEAIALGAIQEQCRRQELTGIQLEDLELSKTNELADCIRLMITSSRDSSFQAAVDIPYKDLAGRGVQVWIVSSASRGHHPFG